MKVQTAVENAMVKHVNNAAKYHLTLDDINSIIILFLETLIDSGDVVISADSPRIDWMDHKTLHLQFEPSDEDIGYLVKIDVEFPHLMLHDTNKAYDRAMKGI